MSGGPGTLLELQGLSAGYGKLQVVDGVDLSIAEHESIGLIGRNGSGKTTLLKAIMGLIPAQSGTVAVAGVDVTRKGAWTRAPLGIGYVPQGRLIFPRLSVDDNLSLGATASKERPAETLAFVHELFPVLRDLRDRRAGALSGGQQQILAVGRALMSSPRLLILDEPTEGIQPSIIFSIADALRYLARERDIALLVVEQRLDFLGRVSDRACIIDRGAIVERLPFDELMNSPLLHQKYLGV